MTSPLSSKSIEPNTVSNWLFAQRRDHRRELERAGFLRRLRPRLHRSVGEQRVALRFETLRPEPLDDGRRVAVLARVGEEGEECALGRGAGDKAEFLGRQGCARDDLKRIAGGVGRAGHECDLGVVPADVQDGDIGRLELGDFGRIVAFAGDIGLVDRFGDAAAVQLFPRCVGETLAEGRVVMKDRDLLAGPMIGQVVAGHDAVRIVGGDDAEDVGAAEFGQHRIGRRRRNLQDARRLVDFRSRDRGTGAVVSGDEDHTLADQFLGGGDRLLGIACIVRRDELHLLAEHTAGGVDVGYGQLRAALHLLAGPRVLSRHRPSDADQDIRSGRAGRARLRT